MIMVTFFLLSCAFFMIDFFFFFFFFFFFCFFFLSYGGFYDGGFNIDLFSFSLLFLSSWVFFSSILSINFSFYGLIYFWSMFFFILVSFFSSSILIFYVSFEFVFILIFYFLLNWGLSAERLQASFYMFFYTLFFSLPFILVLSDYIGFYSSFFFIFGLCDYLSFFWVFSFIVFIVNLPVYGLHVWLPKAHVEAPVAGSILLAGVLLNLGGYGLYRFFFFLKNLSFSFYYVSFFLYIGLFGGFLTSLICYRQIDLKILIAYSSIVHMSSMLLGLFVFIFIGCWGSLVIIVAHGFISPLLFLFLTEMYLSVGSRSVVVLKGFLIGNSLFCLLWFSSCFLNLGAPPFMSFFSEVFIFGSLGSLFFFDWFFIFLTLFFSGVYSLFIFVLPFHGSFIFPTVYVVSLKVFLVSSFMLFYVIIYPFVWVFPYF